MAEVLYTGDKVSNSGGGNGENKKCSSSEEFTLYTWPSMESLRGLSSCRAVKVPDHDGNNLSERIAVFTNRKSKMPPQTNRETVLAASVSTTDEDRYCRIPFLDILNVIISFAVEKKRARGSPVSSVRAANTNCKELSVYHDARESPFNAAVSITPETTPENLVCSFEDSLHQRTSSACQTVNQVKAKAEILKGKIPESLDTEPIRKSIGGDEPHRWSAQDGTELSSSDKNYLSVPMPSFKRGSDYSLDSFEFSPVLKVSPSSNGYRHSRRGSVPRMGRPIKSPGKGSRFVISPAVHMKSLAKFAVDGPDRGIFSEYILGRIPYRFGRMLLAWCQKGMSPGEISNALYGCPQSKKMQYKGVSIVSWDEDTFIPPGFVLKFETQAEAARVTQDLAKFRTHVQILSMDELMKAVVNMEVAHPPVRFSTLVVRSNGRQTTDPDVQEFEFCLNKYGDVRCVQYLKRACGKELVCEVQYNCVSHGFLAVVALDDSYLGSIGGLRVQFKKCGRNEVLVPQIAKFVQNCLKNNFVVFPS